MNLQEIISNPDLKGVSLSVSAKDLSEFARNIADATAKSILQNQPETQTETEKLLTADEVCTRLSVSRVTLHQWKKKGWLTPVKLGYAVRWRESDVKAIQEGRKVL